MIEEQLGNATEAGKTAIDTTEENTGQMSIDAVLPENTKVSEPILDDNPNRFVLFPDRTRRHLELLQEVRSQLLDRRRN